MPGINNNFTVAAISAGVTVIIYEIVHRLIRWSSGEEKDDEYKDEELPELGERLREREYNFQDGYHGMNNGSYGDVPQRVLKAQQRLMAEREQNPENWYKFRRLGMYKNACRTVAEFVSSKPENLVLVENVTTATNSIVKSFKFQAGDQILVTNMTYGAVHRTVELVTSLNKDVSLVHVHIPVQTSTKEIIHLHTQALNNNPGIKLALVDHIASSTAVRMPIKDLIKLCQSRGVVVAIDGAHCPGQLTLNLEELGADFYYGNLHKWLFAPRGCALLYVHPKHHSWIRTAISSHHTFEENLQERFHYTGTRDNLPYNLAKNAIQFHNYLGGQERITAYNNELVRWAADMLANAWNTYWVELEADLMAPFMRLLVLPQTPKFAQYKDFHEVMYELLHKHGVAAVLTTDGKQNFLRISAQVYNYKEEYYILRDAVIEVLGIERK